MKNTAKSPDAYVQSLDEDRRAQVEAIRRLVRASVPEATEGIVWGMIGYAIDGRPFAGVASQKSYVSLYLMDLYTQPGLREKHAPALSKLKMGKSCINFQRVEELPLDTIAAILKAAPNGRVSGGTMESVAFDGAPSARKGKRAPRKRAKR
jgi:uncharacterized protein YdhG (YjbR/CyaY superfamily)